MGERQFFKTILVAGDSNRGAIQALDNAMDVALSIGQTQESAPRLSIDADFLLDTRMLAPQEIRRCMREQGHNSPRAAR